MAGGKGGKASTGASRDPKSHVISAGLTFPVGRVQRHLRRGNYAQSIGKAVPVYLAAVLEYLTAEILESACDAAHKECRRRIIPRHLQFVAHTDEEINDILNFAIAQSGALPNIHNNLLPQNTKKTDESQEV
ncbi:histone H2A [Coemansia sp. Benny D160-2]|nr:histone H2A [Coemansia sp. Benny D160-2]